MVVVMKERASDAEVEAVIAQLVEQGMDVHRSTGASRVVLGVVGGGKVDPRLIELMAGVHEAVRIRVYSSGARPPTRSSASPTRTSWPAARSSPRTRSSPSAMSESAATRSS